MKVNQVVGEHAKGMRAKKYARKPVGAIAPKKPEAPKASDKQGVAEATPETTMSTLRGYKTWQVWIKNNYYNGKYPDYSARPYRVIAGSADEARQVVLDNADRVLKDLLSKKFPSGKRVLPPKSALPVEAKHIGAVDDGTMKGQVTTSRPITMLSPQGPMTVMLDAGNIVNVEQGVAEVSQQTLQSYRKKAAKEKNDAMDIVNRDDVDDATWAKNVNKASKRKDGIAAANKRLGLEEGVFGLSAKEKGKIQYVTAKISDIPGNWDHKNQTYTEQGLKDLKSVMKNEKYLKYALSLTADDYEADVGEDATITRADQSGTEITDNDTKVKTVIPPEMKAALAPDAENPNEYDLNTTAVAPGAQQDPNQPPKVGSKVEIKKTAESLDDELLEKIRTIAGLR